MLWGGKVGHIVGKVVCVDASYQDVLDLVWTRFQSQECCVVELGGGGLGRSGDSDTS